MDGPKDRMAYLASRRAATWSSPSLVLSLTVRFRYYLLYHLAVASNRDIDIACDIKLCRDRAVDNPVIYSM